MTESAQEPRQLRPSPPYLEVLQRYIIKHRFAFPLWQLMIVVAEKPILSTSELPPDLDTTSIGLTVTQADDRVISEVLDEMLQYVTHDGMVMVNPHPLLPPPHHC